jgi:hypothetical protein
MTASHPDRESDFSTGAIQESDACHTIAGSGCQAANSKAVTRLEHNTSVLCAVPGATKRCSIRSKALRATPLCRKAKMPSNSTSMVRATVAAQPPPPVSTPFGTGKTPEKPIAYRNVQASAIAAVTA